MYEDHRLLQDPQRVLDSLEPRDVQGHDRHAAARYGQECGLKFSPPQVLESSVFRYLGQFGRPHDAN